MPIISGFLPPPTCTDEPCLICNDAVNPNFLLGPAPPQATLLACASYLANVSASFLSLEPDHPAGEWRGWGWVGCGFFLPLTVRHRPPPSFAGR